jgi:hypothetical protein
VILNSALDKSFHKFQLDIERKSLVSKLSGLVRYCASRIKENEKATASRNSSLFIRSVPCYLVQRSHLTKL